MSNKSTPTVATMGIDIGKNWFHVVGLDQHGAIVLRQKHATLPDRHGGLCWGASPEPQS